MYYAPVKQEMLIEIGIEVDSQILNALFCVTGLGLLPWRLRDGYLLVRGNWTKLSKIHAGWYIHGVTKRALMWWVVILFLQNSVWQIGVPPHTDINSVDDSWLQQCGR